MRVNRGMGWYYSKGGMQLGPVSKEALLEKCRSGEVQAGALVWNEGMVDWKPVEEVSEFSEVVSGVQASPPVLPGQTVQPQPAPALDYQRKRIPNYLWQSIVVTLFCCLPFGIVAIVYAAQVDGLVANHQYEKADAASKSAKTWMIASAVTGGIVVSLFFGSALLTPAIAPSS